MCLVAMLTLNRNPGSEEMIECVLNFDVDPFYHDAPPSLIEVSLVTGGNTNVLYKVQAICKDRYVAPVMIRLYGERSELIIDRVRERKVLDALTTAKIGARVIGYFSNGRVESFIQGRALEAEDMIVPDICRKLGGRVGKLHLVDVPGVDKTPSCFKTLQPWIDIATSVTFEDDPVNQLKLDELGMTEYLQEVTYLRSLLENSPLYSDVVFAHNDLTAGNIMYDESVKEITLIDFEYSCYNFLGFDIGNYLCECCGLTCEWEKFPSFEQQEPFLRAYLESRYSKSVTDDEVTKFYKLVQPWALLSHLFWCAWGVVQAKYAKGMGMDYLDYSKKRFSGYKLLKERCLSHTSADL